MYKSTKLKIKPWILPTIVLAQFCCTSLWFAGNSIINALIINFNLSSENLGIFTSVIQFGFIIGTLVFAIFNISDRYNPSHIFCLSAICGALINLGMLLDYNNFYSLIAIRFITGFFLAGIYPVGMKIASDYFEAGLGKSLSFLVGALVLGTAFPHLLNSLNSVISWNYVVIGTSFLASIGGVLILLLVPKGSYQKLSTGFIPSKIFNVFKTRKFKVAAFGYFGHMWELYAFWTYTPVLLYMYSQTHSIDLNISFLSFVIIGIGGLGCIIGGYISIQQGVKKIAKGVLTLSFFCCLFSPIAYNLFNSFFFILFLVFWGMVVIADSPLFSTLVAQNVDDSSKGTALTIVNCIGFSITIISIQLLSYLLTLINSEFVFMVLAIGPLFGLYHLIRQTKIN